MLKMYNNYQTTSENSQQIPTGGNEHRKQEDEMQNHPKKKKKNTTEANTNKLAGKTIHITTLRQTEDMSTIMEP